MQRYPSITLTLLLLLALSLPLFAQPGSLALPTERSSLLSSDSSRSGGWFDASRFSMTQSYGMTFSRWGNRSFNFGVYTNQMEYRVSAPLTFRTSISILHDPFRMIGGNLSSSSMAFLPSVQMEYRPSENFRMFLDIQVPIIPKNSVYSSWGRYGP